MERPIKGDGGRTLTANYLTAATEDRERESVCVCVCVCVCRVLVVQAVISRHVNVSGKLQD